MAVRGVDGYNPAAVAITGGSITGITDLAVADGGTGSSTARAAAAALGVPYILAQSWVAVPAPADTSENILATITIPAGALGPNGSMEVYALFSYTNGADDKIPRMRLGGISGTILHTRTQTTTDALETIVRFGNRNAQNSQVARNSGWAPYTSATNAPTTAAIDTSAQTTLVITGQKETGANTLTLEGYRALLFYGA